MKRLAHSPGPWFVRGTLIESARNTVAALSKSHLTVDPEESAANAHLIAAAPTMAGKLADTVAWLDREILSWETIDTPLPTRATADLIERLTELRDDLAETLRKITEGE